MTSSRSTNKILVFIIILLLLTNIAVLVYFFSCCKKKPMENKGKDTFSSILQKEVGFTQQQVDQFNTVKQTHWEQAKANMKQIVRIKNNIFDLSRDPNTPDSIVEKMADSIGILQKTVEIEAYKHVCDTRKICTPEQQPAYDSLMKRIINRDWRGGKSSNNHPPKEEDSNKPK